VILQFVMRCSTTIASVTRCEHCYSLLYAVRIFSRLLLNVFIMTLEIRSMERGICPIAVFYFALKRSFFNI